MRVEYEVTKEERKAMVTAIAEVTGCKPEYQGVPSCAYKIGDFMVEKNGTIEYPDDADADLVSKVSESLATAGVIPAKVAKTKAAPKEKPTAEPQGETEAAKAEEIDLTVTIPADKVAVGNLNCILDAKGTLIKNALGIEELPVEADEKNVSFPWFKNIQPDEALAYTKFIGALCEMSIKQKRITARPKEDENEKYAFRCFRLRLGFSGDEYKADRKILLSKLDGSSAFKSGQKGGAK